MTIGDQLLSEYMKYYIAITEIKIEEENNINKIDVKAWRKKSAKPYKVVILS